MKLSYQLHPRLSKGKPQFPGSQPSTFACYPKLGSGLSIASQILSCCKPAWLHWSHQSGIHLHSWGSGPVTMWLPSINRIAKYSPIASHPRHSCRPQTILGTTAQLSFYFWTLTLQNCQKNLLLLALFTHKPTVLCYPTQKWNTFQRHLLTLHTHCKMCEASIYLPSKT